MILVTVMAFIVSAAMKTEVTKVAVASVKADTTIKCDTTVKNDTTWDTVRTTKTLRDTSFVKIDTIKATKAQAKPVVKPTKADTTKAPAKKK